MTGEGGRISEDKGNQEAGGGGQNHSTPKGAEGAKESSKDQGSISDMV